MIAPTGGHLADKSARAACENGSLTPDIARAAPGTTTTDRTTPMARHLRNRKTGERYKFLRKPSPDTLEAAYVHGGLEPDPGHHPDAPAGWRGTYPFIGSDVWRENNHGRFAIVNVNLQENGTYTPGASAHPWQLIMPNGEMPPGGGFDTHAEALDWCIGTIECPHEFAFGHCQGCGSTREHIEFYSERPAA